MPSALACQMSSVAPGTGLPLTDSTRPLTQTSSPFMVAPSRRSPPCPYSFAPCAKKGPSTVASVAPGRVLWLSATIIIERPSTSESRMNSCRLSSHFWPTAVRNLMPSNHSSSVRCTSRAKACRCFTALAMIWRWRAFLVLPRRLTTSAVRLSSLNWRPMDSSLLADPSVLSKKQMRLVTFTVGNTPQRTGALVEGGRKVLDLQAAYGRTYHGSSPVLETILRVITAGDEAVDMIGQLLEASHPSVCFSREETRLLAPVPVPPQMRDFLCFEKHLVQAFKAIGRTPPQAWYERPIFYHPSRFSVCGTDTDA